LQKATGEQKDVREKIDEALQDGTVDKVEICVRQQNKFTTRKSKKSPTRSPRM